MRTLILGTNHWYFQVSTAQAKFICQDNYIYLV